MAIHWGGKGPGHVSRWPKAVGPVNTYSGATMLLDFLNPVLDPRITFSRGTNATLIDSTGRLTYAPANLLTWSEQFTDASWIVNGSPVITANQVIAPNGTMTADTIAVSGASNGFGVYRNVVSSGTYASSLYFKLMSGAFTLRLGLTGNHSEINCATLAITNAGTGVGSVTAVGDGWYRFVSVGTISVLSASQIYNIGSNTGTLAIWGAQLEQVTYQTTPSTYVATTASAYYAPRFDYDPVTLAPRGLLIEEARTNLLTYSDAFDNTTGWPTATNVTVTANVTASPDGTVNADLINDGTTAAVQHRLFRGSVTFTATAHTYSIYAKAGTGSWFQLVVSDGTTTFYANFNVSTGVTGNRQASTTSTITNAGNGWYRCTMTATTAAGTGNIQIGMLDADAGVALPSYTGANRTLFFYGAQLEAGSFATSYIPTVASTVTRNADVATMTGTNFSSWYNQSEGTLVAGTSRLSTSALDGISTTAYTDGNNNIELFARTVDNRLLVFNGGVAQVNLIDAGKVTANTIYTTAAAYALNNYAFTTNGGALLTDTSATVPTAIALGIGSRNGSLPFNGHIRTIAYFNTRLPNAQLQTLTAPSLATTLSLDFTTGSYNVGF